MGLRMAAAILTLSMLPGCGAGVLVVYDGTRQAAKGVIGQVLAETTPGIDQERGSACVMQALTRREVLSLGTGDSTGPSNVYRAKVAEVRLRPGVADCLAAVPVAG
jgi:hypothetical protein